MAKQDEVEYPIRIGESLSHAAAKPFSDPNCGQYLVRIGAIMSLLPPAPARVLDLGCGTGWTSQFFARAGYETVGVDIAPEMVRVANGQRDAAGLPGLSFLVCDYESLPFRGEFDAAVFFDSLHHAEDEGAALRGAFEALKPGGLLLAEEPGEGHAGSEAAAAAAAFGVTEKDMPPARVVALGREVGFTQFRAYPHPDELCLEVYGKRAAPVADPFADTEGESRWSKRPGLRRKCRQILSRLRRTPPWRLQGVDHLLIHVHQTGLVLMRKPGGAAGRAAG